MKRLTLLAVALIFSGLISCSERAGAQIIHVPQDQPTIAQGIAAASPGWTVIVAPGVYAEHSLSFQGKAVTLTGANPQDRPIIEPGENTAFLFDRSGETSATLIRDLVIRGLYSLNYASAIEIRGDSPATAPAPVFRNVRVENCRAAVNAGSACVVCNLPFPQSQVYDGPSFYDCEFIDNGFLAGIPNADQYGVVAIGHSKVRFERCVFRENRAQHSPALYVLSSELTMIDCLVAENESFAAPSAITIKKNDSQFAVAPVSPSGDIVNCTIAGNLQSGFMLGHEDTAVYLSDAALDFVNTIVAENEYVGTQALTASRQIFETGPALSSYDHCLLGTGANQLANVTNAVLTAPAFVGFGATAIDRFRLRAHSPALDAGLANAFVGFFDLAGSTRFSGSAIDIGALEGAFSAPPLYPGSGEDFELALTVAGSLALASGPVPAMTNDTANFFLSSPLGGFVNRAPLLVAQVIPLTAQPGNPTGYPEAWIQPGVSPAPIVLFDGNAQGGLLGPILLPPAGISLNAVVPPQLGGTDFVVQGFALASSAANGFFASSDAYFVEVQ